MADVVEADGSGVTAVLGAAAERAIPAVGAAKARPAADAGEDTLIRARPAVPAAAAPGRRRAHEAEDEARYNPQPPHKRRLPRVLVGCWPSC